MEFWKAGKGRLLKFGGGGKGGIVVFFRQAFCPQTFAECDSLLCPEPTSR